MFIKDQMSMTSVKTNSHLLVVFVDQNLLWEMIKLGITDWLGGGRGGGPLCACYSTLWIWLSLKLRPALWPTCVCACYLCASVCADMLNCQFTKYFVLEEPVCKNLLKEKFGIFIVTCMRGRCIFRWLVCIMCDINRVCCISLCMLTLTKQFCVIL